MSRWGHTWDLESGYCPYGHLLTECMKVRTRDGGRRTFRFCSIHYYDNKRQREREKRALLAKAWSSRNQKLYEEPIPEIKDLPEEVLVGRPIGTKTFSGRNGCHVLLVCGHWNKFEQTIIADFKDPGPIWCYRCVDWKFVHEVSNCVKGGNAYVFYPLKGKS